MAILGNKLRSEYKNRPIILLTEWSTNQESTVPDSGFTEGAADAFFASMVKLDQQLKGKVGEEVSPGDGIYDEKGKLRRQQGYLFNSPMHFIGFSRGTVVNSEIIQRLGKYYPLAGGFQADSEGNRIGSGDLQMTTIDPHDFAQEGLDIPVGQLTTEALVIAAKLSGAAAKNPRAGKIAERFVRFASEITGFNEETLEYSDFKEPPVQVWDNISFADNYYQTTNTGNNPTNLTPNGRQLVNTNPDPYNNAADLNLDLTEFRGFKGIEAVRDNPIGGAHSKVLAWYAGTVDQALKRIDNEFVYERDGIEIQDRKGEVNVENWYDRELDPSAPLWYSSSTIPDEYDPEEGIGTGWYYSYLNGGERTFDNPARSTVTTAFDNTSDPRSRGDFAVPTLFNGNFDASFSGNSESVTNNGVRNFWQAAIPGWSYHNGRPDQFDREGTSVKYGIDIENLVDWKNIDTLADYRQQVGYSETQPNFALKMDGGDSIVHNRFVVPDWGVLRFNLHASDPNGGNIQVSIKEADADTWQPLTTIAGENSVSDSVSLIEGDYSSSNPRDHNPNELDFAIDGFETFHFNIPDNLRGKAANIRFQVEGNTEVYLDDVFFHSSHLMLGNPTLTDTEDEVANQEARFNPNAFPNNYLVERPQYAFSYNNREKGPNWVSYKLNKSWLGDEGRVDGWASDYQLLSPLSKTEREMYNNPQAAIIAGGPYMLNRGHMVTRSHRNRTIKDQQSTYFLSSILPQHRDNNIFNTAWRNFEAYLKDQLVVTENKEVYVISGGIGSVEDVNEYIAPPYEYTSSERFIQSGINYPEETWKIAVILEPGQTIADIDNETKTISIITPNERIPANLTPEERTAWQSWDNWLVSVDDIEEETGLNLLSNIPKPIQDYLESIVDPGLPVESVAIEGSSGSNLLADQDNQVADRVLVSNNNRASALFFNPHRPRNISSIFQEGFTEETANFETREISNFPKISSNQNSISQTHCIEIRPLEIDSTEISVSQITEGKICTPAISPTQVSFTQNSMTEIGIGQVNAKHSRPTQISPTQISPTQISPTQINIRQTASSNSEISEIPFSSSVFSNELSFGDEFSFNFHNSNPEVINRLNNTATNIWSDLLQTETQLDIDFQITDLPTGQLAEATITDFNDSGKPNAGTILIDHDANGVGWFIDETPLDNSEFTAHLSSNGENTDSYLLAAAESEASGKYDLLTTVLHELAHLYGFIDGYEGFDANIETEDGTTKFVGDDFERGSASRLPRQAQVSFEAVLDGEHLDKQAHPDDLLNTHLAPGIRKLPSELDVEILQALVATELDQNGSKLAGEELLAKLTSDPLLAIANGDFSISNTTTESFAWDTRGASNIENGQAVLTEDSPFLSNFTQTFTVPEEAKTIQFKLIGAELGASELAPPDAFEVALLDADTNESLTAVSDLSNTDSLLNIQNDGTAYFSDKVKIGGATSGEIIGLDRPRTVTVDISDLTAGTEATLYFDLLGFGDVDSRVVIDDVRLSDQFLLPPVANDDTATVNQGETVAIDILANDTDDDGTLDLDSVQIITEPANGTATVNNDGTVSYTPSDRFVGEDSFTYTVADNDEQQSETASVNITVENAIPEISEVQIPDTVIEGVEVSLSAIASDAGNDELTYSWTIDGETSTENSPQIDYTFPDNGTYTGSVTVTDTHGGSDTQTFEVTVENAVPVVDAGSDVTIDEGSSVEFAGSYSDTGTNDIHR